MLYNNSQTLGGGVPRHRTPPDDNLLRPCSSYMYTAALFAVFIYTDDPIFIIVGALRMARGLHIWTTLCKEVELLMAIETKRQCGTHVEWLGAGISSLLAMAWVPKHKIAAALTKIEVTLAGNSTMQM